MSPLLSDLLARHDSAPAVRVGSATLSYGELSGEIMAARNLLHRAGIGPGCRVAFCLPKSLAALRLLLATLAAGAAYVPLNPRLSASHLATILADLRPTLLVADAALLTAIQAFAVQLPGLAVTSDIEVIPQYVPGHAAPVASPADLAAILFTSGSTGVPKGIMLSHTNIFSFSDWAAAEFALTHDDRVASHAPFHFDLSTFDIFATLARGACLHLLDESQAAFPGAVRKFIADAGITTWYSVPTALMRLQQRGALAGLTTLRTVLFAGEVFPTPALRRVMADLPGAAFANLFGPTETNVCLFHRLPGPPGADEDAVPIGIPCPHASITLSETDEILVAGAGVMLGYWRRPSLTEASRVNGRADSYRTGDIASRRGDGVLMFTGRQDQQIKLRGHRIELLGLEAVLRAHPAVREAVAAVSPDAGLPDARLIVFLVAHSAAVTETVLRNFIAARLAPSYQPNDIVWLNDLPRSSTGKTDRAALLRRFR